MATKKRMSPVQLAAAIYGCRVEELLSYREYEDGSVVIIAPSGQKFSYSAEVILQFMLGEESPPAPLDKGGEEAAQATLSVAAALDKGGAEAPEVPKVSKVAKVAEVVNEHSGTAKGSR